MLRAELPQRHRCTLPGLGLGLIGLIGLSEFDEEDILDLISDVRDPAHSRP